MKDTKTKMKGPNRPPTKTIEPPTRKQPEQLPADDGGGNEGMEPEQEGKVGTGETKPKTRTENRPIEKESGSDENSGCGC